MPKKTGDMDKKKAKIKNKTNIKHNRVKSTTQPLITKSQNGDETDVDQKAFRNCRVILTLDGFSSKFDQNDSNPDLYISSGDGFFMKFVRKINLLSRF